MKYAGTKIAFFKNIIKKIIDELILIYYLDIIHLAFSNSVAGRLGST
jgi:hypothetical protein